MEVYVEHFTGVKFNQATLNIMLIWGPDKQPIVSACTLGHPKRHDGGDTNKN